MKKFQLILLFFLAAAAAGADELTWQDVLAEAKAKNPALKKSEESLKQARLGYYSAYTDFLPKLSASAGTSQSKSGSSDMQRNYSYGLSGSISLFSGFAGVAGLKSKETALRISEANYARTLADTVYQLKNSFLNLLWAQETANLSSQILNKRKENFEMVELKYDSGTEDKGSLMRVEADRLQAEFDLDKARRNLRSASLQLVKAIGRDDFEIVIVTGTFEVSDPGSPDLKELAEKTPEYTAAKLSVEKSNYDLISARSGFYPDLSLSASTSKSGSEWEPQNSGWNLGLSLSYSFFPGGKNIIDAKIAKSSKLESEESLKQTRQQLAVSIDSALNSFINSARNVAVSVKYLNASEEQSRITATKYINGLASYLEWYSAENDHINSMRSFLNSKRDAALQEANFKKVAGQEE
ncbi:MAG: TolC family protein [Elusimicrobiota bacterium]